MAPDAPISLGFARRLDVMAVAKPKVMRLYLWFFGLMSIWALIGLASSLAAGHGGVAAVFGVAVLFPVAGWLLVFRAHRRAPETLRALEQLRGS